MPKIKRNAQRLAPPAESPAESDVPTYDVTPFAAEIDLAALDVIRWAPVWMSRAERLLLFSLTFGLRPARYLEIGTLKGGSALVVAAAMDASGNNGRLVCVDPRPQIDPEHWKRLEKRTTLIAGLSPAVLPRAYAAAGGLFDFVLIDGDHTRTGVLRDATGILPFVARRGYLLFHDSLFPEVAHGINDFVTRHQAELVDCGILTREVTLERAPQGEYRRWGGLRLVQVGRSVEMR
jgi:predicted O-methyltransferase YrrM